MREEPDLQADTRHFTLRAAERVRWLVGVRPLLEELVNPGGGVVQDAQHHAGWENPLPLGMGSPIAELARVIPPGGVGLREDPSRFQADDVV